MSAPAMSNERDGKIAEAVAKSFLEALAEGLSGGKRSSGNPGGSGGFSRGSSSSSHEVFRYVKFVPKGTSKDLFYRNIGPITSKEGYGYFPHKNAQYHRVYQINLNEWNNIIRRISSNPYWSKNPFGSGYAEATGTTSRSPLVIDVWQPDIRTTNPDGRRYGNPLGKGGGSADRFKRDTRNSAIDAQKQIQRFFRSPFGN